MKFSSGIYFLYFGLKEGHELKVGKLGRASFPKGFYVYIGSAQKNLPQRLARHLRKEKSPHWHIDYLLPHAKILSIHVFKASKEWECRLSRRLAGLEGAGIIMKGFGASDCRCPSHLFYFPYRPRFKRINLIDTKTAVIASKAKQSHYRRDATRLLRDFAPRNDRIRRVRQGAP